MLTPLPVLAPEGHRTSLDCPCQPRVHGRVLIHRLEGPFERMVNVRHPYIDGARLFCPEREWRRMLRERRNTLRLPEVIDHRPDALGYWRSRLAWGRSILQKVLR